MLRKLLLGSLAVFVLWLLTDFLFHGYLLSESYINTQRLWRPLGEEKMGLYATTVALCSILFTTIYALLISAKGMLAGVIYGFLFGAAAGISTGYGSYAFMPLPYHMALLWMLCGIVQGVIGGIALALIVRRD